VRAFLCGLAAVLAWSAIVLLRAVAALLHLAGRTVCDANSMTGLPPRDGRPLNDGERRAVAAAERALLDKAETRALGALELYYEQRARQS